MAATGWWFILWLWAPIYGSVLSEEFFQPLWTTFNSVSGAEWFASPTGTFVVTLITIGVAGLLVLAWHWPGTRGCRSGSSSAPARHLILVIIMLTVSKNTFISSFNTETAKLFGFKNSYAAPSPTPGRRNRYTPSRSHHRRLRQSMLLVPMLMFLPLWPTGAPRCNGEYAGRATSSGSSPDVLRL